VNKNEPSMELCWEPIHDYFDRQRWSYFARFSNLLNTRLYKLIYKELICKNVFCHINEVFKNIGLYHYLYWYYDKQNFNKFFFGQISRIKQFEVITFKTSLGYYNNNHVLKGAQKYLINVDQFESSR
jgi:hypothetical protein